MPLIKNELQGRVHKRLRLRLGFYFVISILILGVSIFHVARDNANILFSVLGLLVGGMIGIVVSRIYKISWDENTTQVIARFDAIGIFILAAYIAFELLRDKIVGIFVSDSSVIAVSFAVLAGMLFGRVVGIRGKILEIFKEEGIV